MVRISLMVAGGIVLAAMVPVDAQAATPVDLGKQLARVEKGVKVANFNLADYKRIRQKNGTCPKPEASMLMVKVLDKAGTNATVAALKALVTDAEARMGRLEAARNGKSDAARAVIDEGLRRMKAILTRATELRPIVEEQKGNVAKEKQGLADIAEACRLVRGAGR